jgi:hypothetical protein
VRIGRDPSAVFIQGILNMHRFLLSLSAAAVLTAGVLVPNSASATPLSGATGLRLVADTMDPVENVAICFYVDGWNGPACMIAAIATDTDWAGTVVATDITIKAASMIAGAAAITMVATMPPTGGAAAKARLPASDATDHTGSAMAGTLPDIVDTTHMPKAPFA